MRIGIPANINCKVQRTTSRDLRPASRAVRRKVKVAVSHAAMTPVWLAHSTSSSPKKALPTFRYAMMSASGMLSAIFIVMSSASCRDTTISSSAKSFYLLQHFLITFCIPLSSCNINSVPRTQDLFDFLKSTFINGSAKVQSTSYLCWYAVESFLLCGAHADVIMPAVWCMYKGRVAGGRARVWGHLEGGVPVELKDTKVDIVAGEAALEQLQADPDALVFLPVWVRRRPSRHHPRPISHQHLRNMVERSQQKCNNSYLQRF